MATDDLESSRTDTEATARPRHVTRLRPNQRRGFKLWREVLGYRELVGFLAWRDIKVRYRQTVLGAAWAILQPFVLMVVFSAFFGKLAKVPSNGFPYPVFSYAGLVPWTLFSQALTGSSQSMVTHSALVSKTYFPRIILPVASAGVFLIDFVIALALVFGMLPFYHLPIRLQAVALVPLTILTLAASLSIGIWLSAVNVRYRDVRYAVPFLLQVLMFASPVVYPTTVVPAAWRWLYGLNPMAGVIEAFRWALLGAPFPGRSLLVTSITMTIVLLITGVAYFHRVERTLADVI